MRNGSATGQGILQRLAEDILNLFYGDPALKSQPELKQLFDPVFAGLLNRLQFDGYVYKGCKLRSPESDVLDTKEYAGVLEALYADLQLANRDVALHCLKLSEDHWLSGNWDDCISQARRFLECVLREVAISHSLATSGVALPDRSCKRPVEVRQYLEKEGLLGADETEALAKCYGLLSATGSHPYIAQQDQARLLRQLALVLSQFILLRYQGYLNQKP